MAGAADERDGVPAQEPDHERRRERAELVQAAEGASDTAYFGGLAVVTIVFALILYTLSPWIRRHTDLRQTS